MKDLKDVLKSFITAFRKHPNHQLYFAVMVLFIVAGGLVSVVKNEPWVLLASLAVSLVGALTLAKIQQGKSGAGEGERITPPSPPESDLARKALREEIKHVYDMVDAPWIKKDLAITLEILDCEPHSAGRAKIRFFGKFYVVNSSKSAVQFDFFTQIDVSRSYGKTVGGKLEVTDKITGGTVFRDSFNFVPKGDPRGLEHMYRNRFQLPALSEHSFQWKTDEYEIDIPYAEFWATAHPLLGMQVTVEFTGATGLTAHGDCYRRLDEPGRFKSDKEDARCVFEAEGPFLPYQGVFVEIDYKSTPTSL